MIFQSKKVQSPQLLEDDLVLDIETTGFSRDRDQVFLVGLQGPEELGQYFLDDPREERDLLVETLGQMAHKRILSYNGDAFDLPFLAARAARYQVVLPPFQSMDFYPWLRKRKKFFALEDLKLKSLEVAAGLKRQDTLFGGQVAALYAQAQDPAIRSDLLLHNFEDVSYLTKLLPFFNQLSEKLKIQSPIQAELLDLSFHKDLVQVRYQSALPAHPEKEVYSSFGSLTWQEHTLLLQLPYHVLDLENEERKVLVSPTGQADLADHPLPPPFLTLEAQASYVPANLHRLVQALWDL